MALYVVEHSTWFITGRLVFRGKNDRMEIATYSLILLAVRNKSGGLNRLAQSSETGTLSGRVEPNGNLSP